MRKDPLLWISLLLNLLLFLIFTLTHRFYPPLMLLHILSLLILWIMILRKTGLGEIILNRKKEIIIVLILTLASLFVGLYKVEQISPGIYGDEVDVGRKSLALMKDPDLLPYAKGFYHPTPLMYMTAISVNALGPSRTSLRLPSIIFGALCVTAFFILLRLFFPLTVATLGAGLLVFQYTHIVLMKLAYEPSASLFWQILSVVFLVLFYRKKNTLFLLGIALSLGGGLYTYLNFRPFAALIFLLALYLVLRNGLKKNFLKALLFSLFTFTAVMPLVATSIIDPQGFWGRVSEISIFSRGYPPEEFVKELWGNFHRIVLFPIIGDPNPGKNPAGTTLFDLLTVLISFIGMIYLFIEKRRLFWLMLLLFLPPLASDVFSTEVIPEFHYYGLGHPNALRVSGLILAVLFPAAYAINKLNDRMKNYELRLPVLILICSAIYLWNFMLYFNQKDINQQFYLYNYQFNGQEAMMTIDYLNQNMNRRISMTAELAGNERFPFFLDPSIKLSPFEALSKEKVLEEAEKADAVVIHVNEKSWKVLESITVSESAKLKIKPVILNNPLDSPAVVILEKELPIIPGLRTPLL